MTVVSHEDGSIDDFPAMDMPDEHIKFEQVFNEYGNLEIKRVKGKYYVYVNGYNANGQQISNLLYNLLKKELVKK